MGAAESCFGEKPRKKPLTSEPYTLSPPVYGGYREPEPALYCNNTKDETRLSPYSLTGSGRLSPYSLTGSGIIQASSGSQSDKSLTETPEGTPHNLYNSKCPVSDNKCPEPHDAPVVTHKPVTDLGQSTRQAVPTDVAQHSDTTNDSDRPKKKKKSKKKKKKKSKKRDKVVESEIYKKDKNRHKDPAHVVPEYTVSGTPKLLSLTYIFDFALFLKVVFFTTAAVKAVK